jgi:hypothetical protein
MASLRLTLTLTVDGRPLSHMPLERRVDGAAAGHLFHVYENILTGSLHAPITAASGLVLQSDGHLAMTWDGVAATDLPFLRAGGVFAIVDGSFDIPALTMRMVGEAATIHGAVVGTVG